MAASVLRVNALVPIKCAVAKPTVTRQLEILALRSIELADRVAAGQLPFIDAVDLAYEAAIWADLAERDRRLWLDQFQHCRRSHRHRHRAGDHRRCLRNRAAAVMTELRPYQSDVLAEVDQVIGAGKRRIIVVAPTGAGKTIIASDIIEAAQAKRQRVLVLAHTREIIKQTSAKLFDTASSTASSRPAS